MRTTRRSRLAQEFQAIVVVQWVSGDHGLVGDWAEPKEGSIDASLVGLSLTRCSRLEVIAGRVKPEKGDERLSKICRLIGCKAFH